MAKYIWFIEEDVFIPKIDTLINIDKKYSEGDLLCRQNIIYNNIQDIAKLYHFQHLIDEAVLDFPWAKSMICAIRCSVPLIKCMVEHAEKYGKFYYDEFIFNTIALQNNLSIKPSFFHCSRKKAFHKNLLTCEVLHSRRTQ